MTASIQMFIHRSNNSIIGNICADNTSETGNPDGIQLDYYAKYNVVDGNNCTGNDRYGIYEGSTGTEKNLFVANVVSRISITGTNSVEIHNMTI